MLKIDFGAWSPRDFAAGTLTGGGLNYKDTRLTEVDGKTAFEMFDRKELGHRVKFVETLEDAAAGNIYRISVSVRLGETCSVDSAPISVGVIDPMALFPAFIYEPQTVTKHAWTEIEFTHTLADNNHSAVSVEQSGKNIPLAESILVGEIRTELLHRVERKEVPDQRKTLWIIGDSIACNYASNVVTRGWGMYIGDFLDDSKIKVCNFARAGFSTKSFIHTDGLSVWCSVCKRMRKGDYLAVSLGINDFSSSLSERRATREEYADNLRAFADEAKRLGVSLLFITSTVTVDKNPIDNYRRSYLEAMIEVAEEKRTLGYDLSYIDLNAYMLDKLQKVEKREGYDYVVNRYFICGVNADGTAFRDTTHQCEEGSKWVTSMIAELLKNSDFSLKEYLK